MTTTESKPADRHNWVGAIQTYSGNPFHLLNPRPEEVSLTDIAHALSLQCRYNGHIPAHYSVAEHSVVVSRLLKEAGESPEVQLAGLLHDAAEAYVGDMVRPMKLIPEVGAQFGMIEDAVSLAIFIHFGIEDLYPLVPAIHHADKKAYEWEVEAIRTGKEVGLDPWEAESAFTYHHGLLMGKVKHRMRMGLG